MSSPRSWDCDEVVRRFEAHEGLRRYVQDIRGMKIDGSDLHELTDPGNVGDILKIGSFAAKKVASLVIELIGKQDLTNVSRKETDTTTQGLPAGKRYAYFASHKKQHTRFGDSSADLARASKDYMKLKYNLEGYFDADNLQKINKAAISRGIVESCSVLLYLNDETLESEWCRHEVDEAWRYGIPIIVLVDVDKQTAREVIDKYMESGYSGYLFDEQVISYSTMARELSYELSCKAIRRAIQHCHDHDTLTPKHTPEKPRAATTNIEQPPDENEGSVGTGAGKSAKNKCLHDANDATGTCMSRVSSPANKEAGALAALKKALISEYDTAEAAFEALSSSNGVVGRKEWKKAIKKTSHRLEDFTGTDLKALRASLPKTKLSEFCSFINGSSASEKTKEITETSHLAVLPPEVPQLPSSFRPREHAQAQLTTALLESGRRSTSLTAPKSRISSQGMGGVGKTMLTAAVVRSTAVRRWFKVICWLNLSQEPGLVRLQSRCYNQLVDDDTEMPSKASKSIEDGLTALRKAAQGKLVLLVLDDMWSREHAQPFDCVDVQTNSKLLVTTRIKGILDKGKEVELELLSVRESVELLSAVAQLDTSEVSPCMIEIAQLCGRLPLCLNIVGNLIRTYGDSGWEEEIPTILKKDMKSLTTGKGDSSQPLNLQQRVIQSGLDSLEGEDAASIVTLFRGMAVFAEDQIVPVAILSVLWVSIDPKKHKPLSGMKVRQWVSQLLSRSILLGSSADGVSLHDIVRDFTLAAMATSVLQQSQQKFVDASMDTRRGVKVSPVVVRYAHTDLAYHVSGAIDSSISLPNNTAVHAWLANDDDPVQLAVIHGVVAAGHSADAIKQIAADFGTTGRHFASARLYRAMVFSGVCDQESQLGLLQASLQQIEHIPRSEETAATLTFATYSKIKLINIIDSHEGARMLDSLVSMLENDTARFSLISAKVQASVKSYLGSFFMGIFKGPYAASPDFHKGAQWFAEAKIVRAQLADKIQIGTFERWFELNVSFHLFAWTICYLCGELVLKAADVVLGVQGAKLIETAEQYDYGSYHKKSNMRGMDTFLVGSAPLNMLLVSFANIEQYDMVLEKFCDATIQGRADTMDSALFGAWGHLSPHNLGAVCRAHEFTWRSILTSEYFPRVCLFKRFSQGEDEALVTWLHTDTIEVFLKMLMIRLPGSASATEVSESLPETDNFVQRDRIFEIVGTSDPLGALVSSAASYLGDVELAIQHAHATAVRHRNPIKIALAHKKLGMLVTKQQLAQQAESR